MASTIRRWTGASWVPVVDGSTYASAGFANVVAGATTLASTTTTDTLTLAASTGIAITGAAKTATFTNTGVTSLTASAGQLTASSASGAVTLSLAASPSVSGTITAGTFSGSGSALTAVPASALTGSTLPSNVTASSLTSLGTVTSLTATSASITNASVGNLTLINGPRSAYVTTAVGKVASSADASTPTPTNTTATDVPSCSVTLTNMRTTDRVIINATFDVQILTTNTIFIGEGWNGASAATPRAIFRPSVVDGRATVHQSWVFTPAANGSVTFKLTHRADAGFSSYTLYGTHTGFSYQVLSSS